MKNKKLLIALIAFVAVIAVAVGIFFATRPQAEEGSKAFTVLVVHADGAEKKFEYKKGDTEGFVNMPLSMKGICFSVFLREDTEKDMIKVSLRSVGTFPCNEVAAEFFNGGGHLNASGGEFYGPLEDAIALFKQALVKYEDLLLGKNS